MYSFLQKFDLMKVLSVLFLTPCICFSNILMVSQEKGLQISTDLAHSWSKYDLGEPTDHVDFFDANFDQATSTLYIVGYDKRFSCLVVFSSYKGQTFNKKLINIIPENSRRKVILSKGDQIDFIKIRFSRASVNIFGRVYLKNNPLYDLRDSSFRGFHVSKYRITPVGENSNQWTNNQVLTSKSAVFFDQFSTILDIFTAKRYCNAKGRKLDSDILYYSTDPYLTGPYPFFLSANGDPYLFQSFHKDVEINQPQPATRKIMPGHRLAEKSHHKYPLLYQGSEPDSPVISFVSGEQSLFAKNISDMDTPLLENQNYDAIGTVLFTTTDGHQKDEMDLLDIIDDFDHALASLSPSEAPADHTIRSSSALNWLFEGDSNNDLNEVFPDLPPSYYHAVAEEEDAYYDSSASNVPTLEPLQLFLVTKKMDPDTGTPAKAVIAYRTGALTSSTILSSIKESLVLDEESFHIPHITSAAVKAVHYNGFSRFIKEKDHHLFFLSYHDSETNHLSLTLASSKSVLLWEPIPTTLPKSVREIITIPDHYVSHGALI